jgi:poly(3-hydroxybutyrate) depolymerase
VIGLPPHTRCEIPRGAATELPGLDWLASEWVGSVGVRFRWQPIDGRRLYGLAGNSLSSAHAGLSVLVEDREGQASATLRVYLTRGVVGEQVDVILRDGTIEPGREYHVLVTFDGATLRVWLDGVLAASRSLIAPAPAGFTTAWEAGAIGQYPAHTGVAVDVWPIDVSQYAGLIASEALGRRVGQPVLGGDDRPQPIVDLPADYGTQAHPVVVFLHGHSGRAPQVRADALDLVDLADERSTIVVWAQATAPVRNGTSAWNGTSACCWLATNPPDDEGYVRQLVLDLVERYRVDPSRVYLWGSSNGAFLAQACAISSGDLLGGVVAWKGMTHHDPALHTPVAPVRLLHAHGTADEAIDYHGGAGWNGLGPYPSVQEGLDRWRSTNGCVGEQAGETWAGTEAGHLCSETIYPGTHEVRRWDVEGADHAIHWTRESYARALDWLLGGANQ